MGRSRSRSQSPNRWRDRERLDRDRDRDRERRRRQRSRSPVRRRHSHDRDVRRRYSRSRSKSAESDRRSRPGYRDKPVITAADLEGKTPEEQEMMKAMGFCNFDSTKNKKVCGNDVGEVHVILKRKYRQYMNRKGGFNRPLDFVA